MKYRRFLEDTRIGVRGYEFTMKFHAGNSWILKVLFIPGGPQPVQVFEQREGSLLNKDEVVDDERSGLRATGLATQLAAASSHYADEHDWNLLPRTMSADTKKKQKIRSNP